MKIKDWLYVAAAVAAFALGALLFRGCKKPKVMTVVKYMPVNLDSLKATMPRDTVTMPAKQVTKIVRVPVLLSDTATIDSLIQHFAGQEAYYRELIKLLTPESEWGWDFGAVELPMEATVYADSIQTQDYFHRWRIEAEGPIKSYTYGILPFQQPCPECPTAKKPAFHRAGLLVGGQTMTGGLRPIVGASYGFGVLKMQAGYLPAAYGEKGRVQVLMGLEIPIR